MMKPQPGPVIGGILGLLAVVGLAVTLVSPGAGTGALERHVDELFARERDKTPEARHQEVPKHLQELQEMQKDAHFADLPARQRDLVNERVRELTSFTDFAARVDRAPDPKDAGNAEQLQAIKKQLELVQISSVYRAEWEQTETGRRYLSLVGDFTAIEKAADELEKGYRAAAKDGEAVLRNRNAPRLPQRAKAVLENAAKLPTPEKDKDRPLPGSERLTYAAVFRFPSVAEARTAWEKVRDRLKPLAVE